MGTISLIPDGTDGSISMSADGVTGTVTKPFIGNVSLDKGPFEPAVLAQALVHLKEDGITGVASITEWTNSGTGGSAYDLDVVVGTGANLKPHPSGSILFFGAATDYAGTPDVAAYNTTDLDTEVTCIADDYTPASARLLISADDNSGSARDWNFVINNSGGLTLNWFETGGTFRTASSNVAISETDGSEQTFRVTLDVDNGSGGHTVKFYKNGSQLGSDRSAGAFTTSIRDNATEIQIGGKGGGAGFGGTISRARLFDSIDGSAVLDCNPSRDYTDPDATTFTSSTTGEVYTLNGNAFCQNSGHKVVHSIGSAGLETTAGQTINSPATVFAVARNSDSAPSADQHIFDARSNSAARMMVFTNNATADKFAFFQGTGTVPLDEAFDNNPHVFTAQFNGDATSKLTASDVGNKSGDGGPDNFDFGSLFTNFSGTTGWVGNIQALIVFNSALDESEITQMQNYLAAEYNV